MCPFWNQNSVKLWLSQAADRNVEKESLFYIVILECYQTAIQHLGNVTLYLVVTQRHDQKLPMPISGFMQKHSSRQHQQRFI